MMQTRCSTGNRDGESLEGFYSGVTSQKEGTLQVLQLTVSYATTPWGKTTDCTKILLILEESLSVLFLEKSNISRFLYYTTGPIMSHCHDEHASHGGHGHHDHDHDHSDDITPALQSSLYEQINFDEITTLNESHRDVGKAVVKKTWAERLDIEPELASDADEQLLMTVP